MFMTPGTSRDKLGLSDLSRFTNIDGVSRSISIDGVVNRSINIDGVDSRFINIDGVFSKFINIYGIVSRFININMVLVDS